MNKRVLDVGNCRADHGTIGRMLTQHFEVEIDREESIASALQRLGRVSYDLVLVNRLMDRDRQPGLQLIEQMKADPEHAKIPVMLISNYPDQQQLAVEAGAEPGFGKSSVDAEETVQRLGQFLS